ncbi:MAG: MFS transporter [Xanthobacteraceae bacterium]
MSASLPADQVSLLRHRPFMLYWLTRISTTLAYQMMFVAVGWQVYDLTNSAFDLGLVGLILFLPSVFGLLVVGHVADHYDRREVIRFSQIGKALSAAALAVGSMTGGLNTGIIFSIVFVIGACRAFDGPTMHTLVPSIMPPPMISRAIAAGATANQIATIGGPAVGGLLYVFGPEVVYSVCFGAFVIASVLVGLIRIERPPKEKKPVTLETIFAGFSYMRRHPILLGAVSLDLCAVLLGGVIALLPIYARDILETGPWGLGLLRSAPAVGALMVSVFLARISLKRRVGQMMVGSVIIFGLSVVLFGISTSLLLSLAALVVYGAADAASMVVRQSLVQTRTPNEMLGRVMAVSSMFTSSAGTLGQFESGAVAALIGVVPSVLIGGFGAIAIALLWTRLFPGLWRVQSIIPEK